MWCEGTPLSHNQSKEQQILTLSFILSLTRLWRLNSHLDGRCWPSIIMIDSRTQNNMSTHSSHKWINLSMNDNAIMCRVFPIMLKGATLHWYTWLLRNSIDSFMMLITCFRTQYATSRPHHLVALAHVTELLVIILKIALSLRKNRKIDPKWTSVKVHERHNMWSGPWKRTR